jgi:glycosyltransferase involved in cell wall biosynthesis
MKIAQMIDLLYWGGAQKLLLTFAEQAQRAGVELTVIALRSDSNSPIRQALEACGASVVFFPGKGLFDVRRLNRLAAYFRRERFDVVHTHLTYANILGPLAGRLAGVPVVASLHNTRADEAGLAFSIRQQLETWALRAGARAVIGVGPSVAEVNAGILRGRALEVVPNAVTPVPPLPPDEREALRAALCGRSDRPLLIAVGRLWPQKAYPTLLEAVAQLIPAHPELALIIAGGGELHDALAGQIERLNLGENVTLLGPRDDVPRLLGASDVFVLSSDFEGLPVAMLEAMSAGLPVVATCVGDVPAVITDEIGLLVPPQRPDLLAAALDTMLRNPERRLAYGRAGQALIEERYTPTTWYDRLMSIYAAAGTRHA